MQLNSNKRDTALGRLALVATTLIWGSSFVILKNTLDSISTPYMLAYRFSGASLIMLLVGRKHLRELDIGYFKYGALMGACLFFAYLLQTYGLVNTTPGTNAFLTATYCVIVPFLDWFIGKRRPDKFNVSAALICITGIGLVSLQSDFTIGYGEFLTTCCGVFYAAHIIYTARYAHGRNTALLNMVQFSVVALLSWAYALVSGSPPSTLPMPAVYGMAYLCVMCTACCFFLQTFGQKLTSPSSASVILTLESVFGALISALFYGERPGLRLILGFILIFAAVFISETKFSFLRKSKIADNKSS